MTTSFKILLDDIFFGEADTGIARLWRAVLLCYKNNPHIVQSRNLDLWILNRTDKLNNFDFPSIDFPEYDHAHPAVDRQLFSKVLKQNEFRLFVSTYLTFPIGTPSLMVVYDLIPEVFKFNTASRGWLERCMQIIHASKFLCISENTRRDLLSFYNTVVESDAVTVNPGLDRNQFVRSSDTEVDMFKNKHSLTNYVAFIGSRNGESGYKNGDLLFRVLEKKRYENLTFFFVGGDPLSSRENTILNNAKVRYIHERLDDNEWVKCLSGADFLLYPSLYEGFGLPPLEALAVGTPAVICDTSSLRESVRDLGIFIDGYNPEDLMEILDAGICEEVRSRIQMQGPLWAKKYVWENMATELADLMLIQCKNGFTQDKEEIDATLRSYTEKVLYFQN